MKTPTVPFSDLKTLNLQYEAVFLAALKKMLSSGRYILGDAVAQFEEQFAAFSGANYAVGVNSGLDALTLIFEGYKQLGKLNTGDDVLVPANTYIASVLAISRAGLNPILVEPNEETFNLSLDNLRPALTGRTKALMVVDLYGRLAPMAELKQFAAQENLLLIEDAAQAHGATNGKHMAGAQSHAAGFSFYPGKNLGALGDAGAIVTSDPELRQAIAVLRNYGSEQKYFNQIKGFNSRIDAFQAAVLSIKLRQLNDENEKRRVLAETYEKELHTEWVKKPKHPKNRNEHVWHLYVVCTDYRQQLQAYLLQHGIETLIHYPIPPHKQEAYPELNQLHLPVTEKLHNQVLSLPIYPTMSAADQQTVIKAVNAFKPNTSV